MRKPDPDRIANAENASPLFPKIPRQPFIGQLEPSGLLEHFLRHPPLGFESFVSPGGAPGFFADFDLLTTADGAVRRIVNAFPGRGLLRRLLRMRTCFFGTTVSEYAPLSRHASPRMSLQDMLKSWARRSQLMIVKDVPVRSPLLSPEENEHASAFLAACADNGLVVIDGQALAYVPIDFGSEEEYLSRLSAGRRRDIRRKLRSRGLVRIEVVTTGDIRFKEKAFLDELYRLYRAVYDQSEIHFDCLSGDFFAAALQDSALNGRMFLYYSEDRLIGYNLCFIHGSKLIDKYVGFRYPEARQHNLYFVSWMENLAFARTRGLTHYVAGWTDPEIKSYLGASFTFTRHAVFVRNPILRALLRRVSGFFESDRNWFDSQAHASAADS